MRRDELLWWLWHSEKLGAQVALVLSAILWAVLLLLPGQALEREQYEFMAYFGNDYGWAGAWAFSAFLQVVALRTRARKCFLAAGIWACTLHTLAAANFVYYRLTIDQPFPVAIGAEISLAIVAFILYVFAPRRVERSRNADDGLHQGTG